MEREEKKSTTANLEERDWVSQGNGGGIEVVNQRKRVKLITLTYKYKKRRKETSPSIHKRAFITYTRMKEQTNGLKLTVESG